MRRAAPALCASGLKGLEPKSPPENSDTIPESSPQLNQTCTFCFVADMHVHITCTLKPQATYIEHRAEAKIPIYRRDLSSAKHARSGNQGTGKPDVFVETTWSSCVIWTKGPMELAEILASAAANFTGGLCADVQLELTM